MGTEVAGLHQTLLVKNCLEKEHITFLMSGTKKTLIARIYTINTFYCYCHNHLLIKKKKKPEITVRFSHSGAF